ncbi:MAG: hypothetical protein WC052_05350 [Patescibacteria group bacterium]
MENDTLNSLKDTTEARISSVIKDLERIHFVAGIEKILIAMKVLQEIRVDLNAAYTSVDEVDE